MKFFLMGLVKQFTKEAGRSPNPTELANLKKLALEMESSEKIIPFPGGGKDRISPFTPRPENKKSIDLAKELEELTNKNLKERGLGSIKLGDELPPPKNKKPDVDPELQAMDDQNTMFKDFENRTETDAEIIARMNKQNKDSVKRLKEKKEKDLANKLKDFDGDPDAMAQGGLMRLKMFAGGTPLRRLLQYLAGTSGKKGSQNLKDFKISDQMKFFADKQGVSADQNRIDYLEQVLESLYADKKLIQNLEPSAAKMDIENQAAQKFRKDYIDETQGGRYEGLTSEMIDKSILETETMIKNLKTKGRKPNAIGGRIGFDKGSPPSKGRRNFLKLLGGLASIPVFGKLFKAAKPAAKVAKTVEQTTSGVPTYFPKLVEKIKMLGDDVTEIAATKERQKVTKYKGYQLTEEVDTGKKEIKLGDAEYGSEEYMIYDPPETIIGKNNKPVEVPAQYEEVTVKPDMDGKMKDVDAGLDSIDDIMKDADMIETNYKIKPDGRPKKSGGGVAYMLGE